MFFERRHQYFTTKPNKKAKRKKMRSTHACTPSFRNFLHQYSRRVLSILAHHKKNSPKTKTRDLSLLAGFLDSGEFDSIVYYSILLTKYILLFNDLLLSKHRLQKKWSEKKCGAHTHVHHLSQLSFQYSRRLLSILAQPQPK